MDAVFVHAFILYYVLLWLGGGGGIETTFSSCYFQNGGGGGGGGLWKYDYCDVCYFVMGFDGDVLRCAMVTLVHKSFLCNLLAC